MKPVLQQLLTWLPIVISCVALYVSIRQNKVNRLLAFFDKGNELYTGLMRFIASIQSIAQVDDDELNKFLHTTKNKSLLFPPKMEKYLDEVYAKAIELRGIRNKNMSGKEQELLSWFSDQLKTEAKNKFRNYFKLW